MEKQRVDEYVRGSWIRKIIKQITPRFKAFQVTNTIVIIVSIAFIIILGIFVHFRLRKFLFSEDFTTVVQIVSSSSDVDDEFKDLIAPREVWHNMSDEELLWRASIVPRIRKYPPYDRVPKVAFMFLSKKTLPLAPLWELFFKGHQGLYSIYVHRSSHVLVEEHLESSVFYKRTIPSKQVVWGTSTMIDAERRLLANALLDFSNERFILLSESCIPLVNFTTIYNHLINSKHSFVQSTDDQRAPGRGRHNKRMAPTILLSDWRKGSQWFEVQRDVAIEVVSDVTYYPIFRDHCKPECYMDEHYLATLVAKIGKDLNSNRSITYVDWSSKESASSHPAMFFKEDVTEGLLSRVRNNQTNCVYHNVSGSFCKLFARKFHPYTLEPLLKIAPILFGF